LNLNDALSLLELVHQPLNFPFQMGYLADQRVEIAGFSSSLDRESGQHPLISLFAPDADIGMINTFPTQDSSNLAILYASVNLGQDV
jgi:hypothetical protein